MATDDWRRGAAEFNPSNLDRNIALRDALKRIAQRHRTSVSSVAIRMGSQLAGSYGGNRWGPVPRTGGWLDWRRESGVWVRLPLTKSRAIKRTGAGSGPSTPNLESAGRKSAA